MASSVPERLLSASPDELSHFYLLDYQGGDGPKIAKDRDTVLTWDSAAQAAGRRDQIVVYNTTCRQGEDVVFSNRDLLDGSLEINPLLDRAFVTLLSLIRETPYLDWVLLTYYSENLNRRLGTLARGTNQTTVEIAVAWLEGFPSP